MLNIGGTTGGNPTRVKDGGNGSRSTSVTRRRSGEIIKIEEEDEDEVEEVEAFSPIVSDADETIVEGREEGMVGWVDYSGHQ